MFTMLLSPAWWLAKLAMGRGLVMGPFGGALGVAAVAVSVIVVGALVFAWIRDDAASDAQSQCNTERLESDLAAANARIAALDRAANDASKEAVIRRREKEEADATIEALAREKGELRNEVQHLKDAVDMVFRADDVWMRGRRAKGAAAPSGR